MQLNENYRIIYDSDNTILQFFEQREKQIVTKVLDETTGKNKHVSTPSGEFIEYVDNYYYPNLKTALTGFLNKCTWGFETANQVITELNKIELLIKSIK